MEKLKDNRELFSRLEGLLETDILSSATVAVIGLGSGGSLVAVELAKCAVGKFHLVDFDVIEVHNVVRHVCGLRHLGMKKTEAVKDAILDFNPFATVECHDCDITKNEPLLDAIIKDSDIVLVCTDNDASRFHINRKLMQLWFKKGIRIPAIYAGAYERAFGGEVMRVIPGETSCYECVSGALQQSGIMDTIPKGPVSYSSLQDASEFHAEPGLGMDVHFLALLQSKVALLTLLRNRESNLGDIPKDFLFWGNRKEWIFREPFKCIFASTEKRTECTACGQTAQDEAGLQDKVVMARYEAILTACMTPSDSNS